MSEKLLIITEKPSAAKAFSKALGGMSGTFEGDQYTIVNLYGHIIGNPVPDETALPQYAQTVGKFAHLDGIPWQYTWFDFNKKVPSKSMADTAHRVMSNIQGFLQNGYIPVIASDIDPSGEGDLLEREVLIALNYKGKTYREYHVDETPKGIKKALSNLKVVTEDDPTFRMAFTRSNMDYLTQQLTRVATMTIQNNGYKLPAPVPVGRLKSVILTVIGDQLNAIKNYKPSSVFESRYKLDNLVLSAKDMPTYKTKDEWQADGLPLEATVREVKQVRGETIPPKAMTLSQLAGEMSSRGMKSKAFLATYQKMYEAGYMSYPRTEDDFVSPDQFAEMLPLVDTILGVIGLPTAPFSHRAPRSTHVKTGGSHGALRPGLTVPKSLEQLDELFGAHAGEIYKVASERFMMMFLENTEWVRHFYETVDTPKPFTGAIKIITKQGVTDPDEKDDDVATALPDTSKKATLFPYEIKTHKPHAVTPKWLTKQLEKAKVGTGATQVNTLSQMSGSTEAFPIKETKTLDLTTMGWIGYKVAKGTKIGSVEGTRYLTDLIQGVKNGKSEDEAYREFTDVIVDDVNAIKGMSFDLESLHLPKATPKVIAKGVWNGREVQFNRTFMGHEYTDAEVQTLLSGGEIQFEATGKDGKKVKIKGVLAEQVYKGRKYVGLKGEFMRDGYVTGNWQGKEITFKGSFMDHVFTPDEQEQLLAGKSVAIETHKDGKTYNLTGQLAVQEYQGRKFVGYKAVFPTREGYAKGTWNGKEVTIKGSYMDHTFTEDELKTLFAGGNVDITTHKNDKTYNLTGKLEEQEYQGRKFVGYKAVFPQAADRVRGTWHGQNVSFKNEFMKHKFTADEIKDLLAGKQITFKGTRKDGKESDVTGSLAEQTYKGRKFVGFKPDFDNK